MNFLEANFIFYLCSPHFIQINVAASLAARVYERTDLSCPQSLHACLNDQLHKFTSIIQKPELNLFALKGNSPLDSTHCSSHPDIGNKEPQISWCSKTFTNIIHLYLSFLGICRLVNSFSCPETTENVPCSNVVGSVHYVGYRLIGLFVTIIIIF